MLRKAITSQSYSAHLHTSDIAKGGELVQLVGDVANTHSAVVRGAMAVPLLDECTSTHAEAIAAIGVADFHNGTWHRLGLGTQQHQ